MDGEDPEFTPAQIEAFGLAGNRLAARMRAYVRGLEVVEAQRGLEHLVIAMRIITRTWFAALQWAIDPAASDIDDPSEAAIGMAADVRPALLDATEGLSPEMAQEVRNMLLMFGADTMVAEVAGRWPELLEHDRALREGWTLVQDRGADLIKVLDERRRGGEAA